MPRRISIADAHKLFREKLAVMIEEDRGSVIKRTLIDAMDLYDECVATEESIDIRDWCVTFRKYLQDENGDWYASPILFDIKQFPHDTHWRDVQKFQHEYSLKMYLEAGFSEENFRENDSVQEGIDDRGWDVLSTVYRK